MGVRFAELRDGVVTSGSRVRYSSSGRLILEAQYPLGANNCAASMTRKQISENISHVSVTTTVQKKRGWIHYGRKTETNHFEL
jgi:hypothetical protein